MAKVIQGTTFLGFFQNVQGAMSIPDSKVKLSQDSFYGELRTP